MASFGSSQKIVAATVKTGNFTENGGKTTVCHNEHFTVAGLLKMRATSKRTI
jgi:hypothetical protein